MARRRVRGLADLPGTTAARDPDAPSADSVTAPGLRSLQGLIGNRAIARLLGAGAPRAQERPSAAPHVQREIDLDG